MATNLALTLACTSLHVLLVDADLRLPAVHQVLGAESMNGARPSILYYLPAGHAPASPVELLQSPQAQEMLAQTLAPSIVLDAPPVNFFADAPFGCLIDAVLLVARMGVTPRDSCASVGRTTESLHRWCRGER